MDTSRLPTRRLRIFLRDFRMVEAQVAFGDGQSLATYFANRKSYLSLVDTRWTATGEHIRHVAVRVDQVLWAHAPDGDIDLTGASRPSEQRVAEMQLDGGLLLRASLALSDRQRLSDFLEASGPFVPMRDAHLLRSGRPPREVNVTLGDVVLNQDAIQAVWEVDAQTAEEVIAARRDARYRPPAGR